MNYWQIGGCDLPPPADAGRLGECMRRIIGRDARGHRMRGRESIFSSAAAVLVWGLFATSAVTPMATSGHPGIHEQEAVADQAITEHPDDPEAHLTRGKLHHELEQWDAALAAFHRGRTLGARLDRVAILEGNTFLAAGWPRTARERYEEALRAAPDSAEAHIGRARTSMRLGRPGEADPDFAAAFAHLDRVAPALVLERRAALLAAGKPEDALRLLDARIERDGAIPSLQLAAVDLAVAAKRYDDALRRMDDLLRQGPGHPLWATRRAEILEAAGRGAEAHAAYADALSFVQSRTARRNSRRLEKLEGELRTALTRTSDAKEEREQ